MLNVKNISKSYSKKPAIINLCCNIPLNSITGIIGPNGAGKSTFLKIISGFEWADSGSIYADKKELTSFKDKQNMFFFMPEQIQIYPHNYVGKVIEFWHKIIGFKNSPLLSVLQLEKFKDIKIRNLSKGYHQRLKLYLTLCSRKLIAILDEPFDGFDPIQLSQVIGIIKQENKKGRTFILSIHQLNEAQKICNNYILLNEGQLLASGTMDELRDKYDRNASSLEELFIKALR